MARKKKSKLKWLWVTLITIVILVAAGGIYLFTVYGSVKSTVNKDTHEPVKAIDTEVTKEKVAKRDSIKSATCASYNSDTSLIIHERTKCKVI